MESRRAITIALVIAIAAIVTIPVDLYVTRPSAASGEPSDAEEVGFMDHIDHIVFVVLENHAYDNYFGTYCVEESGLCPETARGIPAGICVPTTAVGAPGPCVRPWAYTARNWTVTSELPHENYASHVAWNEGKMDGFYRAENSGLDPFGHYDGTTAPIYWDLAEEYSLSDNFFSSLLSYSLPNHWHIVAGQSPEIVVDFNPQGCPDCNGTLVTSEDHTYLNEANQTESVEDLLLGSDVSWKYYDFTLGNYSNAISIDLNTTTDQIASQGSAYDLWNPQAAKAESYEASLASHFVLNTQFYADARSGRLPSLSWVIPPGQDSDHPPGNSTLAQTWLASVVDAVEASPEWNTTALYITWDDYGGFYDNVPPPRYFGQQLGFRVPLLVISPYTQAGVVSDSMGFFESILHLMEWRFHLGCISELDCKATLPIFGFDWSLPPRAPLMFPTNFSEASYPFNPGWNGTAQVPVGSYVPPFEFTYFPDGEAPDID